MVGLVRDGGAEGESQEAGEEEHGAAGPACVVCVGDGGGV